MCGAHRPMALRQFGVLDNPDCAVSSQQHLHTEVEGVHGRGGKMRKGAWGWTKHSGQKQRLRSVDRKSAWTVLQLSPPRTAEHLAMLMGVQERVPGEGRRKALSLPVFQVLPFSQQK